MVLECQNCRVAPTKMNSNNFGDSKNDYNILQLTITYSISFFREAFWSTITRVTALIRNSVNPLFPIIISSAWITKLRILRIVSFPSRRLFNNRKSFLWLSAPVAEKSRPFLFFLWNHKEINNITSESDVRETMSSDIGLKIH